jgi:hypothetical protein
MASPKNATPGEDKKRSATLPNSHCDDKEECSCKCRKNYDNHRTFRAKGRRGGCVILLSLG